MTSLRRWSPALIFTILVFGHSLILPPLEGMDEWGHLSRILFVAREGRNPKPEEAQLHRGIEKAIELLPGPYHQLGPQRGPEHLSYQDFYQLSFPEQQARLAAYKDIRVNEWEDSTRFGNWQIQHPPLYYYMTGKILSLFPLETLDAFMKASRLLSATFFCSLGWILNYFLIFNFGASLSTSFLFLLFPMWLTMGARISNDALALPAFALGTLLIYRELRILPSKRSLSAFIGATAALAIALAAKAYALICAPLLVGLLGFELLRDRAFRKNKKSFLLLLPAFVPLLPLIPWFAANLERVGSITGQNEYQALRDMGVKGIFSELKLYAALARADFSSFEFSLLKLPVQFLFTSNWSLGAAFPIFYVIETVIFVTFLVTFFQTQRPKNFFDSEKLFVYGAFVLILAGIVKAHIDFAVTTQNIRIVSGWYLWSVMPLALVLLAPALEMNLRRSQRRSLLALQTLAFGVAMLSNWAFWSGHYDRHPKFKFPVKVTSEDL